ncbi:MAG: response regulator [Chitinispirillaceae bacterium]|nr:response regulator [Chitinispirillaceae bacterium]
MNPSSLPSLICLFAMPLLGAFIYSRNRQSRVHRLFFSLTVVIAYWAFTEFNLRQAESYETALFWTRAGCFKIMLSPLLIHFILSYIDKWKEYDLFKAVCLTYFPATGLAIADLLTGSINGFPVKGAWGWTIGRPVYPALFVFYLAWKATALAFVAKETKSYLKDADAHERNSFRLFFYGIIVAIILGIALGAIRSGFPDMSIVAALFFSIYLGFIISKYGLFLSPSDTADDIIDLMGDCLILTGTRNRIVRVNRALLKLTGYHEKELIGENMSRLIDNSSFTVTPREKDELIDSREARLVSRAGRSIPVLLSRTIVYNRGNMPLASVIMAKDLTLWHKSREEFARAEKLESYELIIRSIVHDFNNLLASISGHLFIAEESGTLPESTRKNLDNAEKAALVAANLTRRLALYAKESALEKSVCSLREIIDESAELVLKGTSIRFELVSGNDVWPVNVDRYRMVEVFINLFINSRQAMRDTAGRITVLCANHKDDAGNDYVKISVRDEGEGIPETIAAKVFEPFFTTKPQGTGLGLSIVKNIVESHGGTITVQPRRNIGTTFTILLPKASFAQETVVSVTDSGEAMPPVSILLMDENDSFRMAFSTILGQLGHRVEQVKNGSHAIERLVNAKAEGISFDCVILDLIVTEGVGAVQAIKRIREIDPAIKAILTSGHADHPAIDDYEQHGFDSVLKKPFVITDVRNALAAVFGEKVAG